VGSFHLINTRNLACTLVQHYSLQKNHSCHTTWVLLFHWNGRRFENLMTESIFICTLGNRFSTELTNWMSSSVLQCQKFGRNCVSSCAKLQYPRIFRVSTIPKYIQKLMNLIESVTTSHQISNKIKLWSNHQVK
jgi:hypothetical protein